MKVRVDAHSVGDAERGCGEAKWQRWSGTSATSIMAFQIATNGWRL
jgi:hypothetical protein